MLLIFHYMADLKETNCSLGVFVSSILAHKHVARITLTRAEEKEACALGLLET